MKLRTFYDCMVKVDKDYFGKLCVLLYGTRNLQSCYDIYCEPCAVRGRSSSVNTGGWKFVEENIPKYTRGLKISVVVYSYILCCYISFNTVTLASSHSTLPDGGDHTETCWSCCNCNVNFGTP